MNEGISGGNRYQNSLEDPALHQPTAVETRSTDLGIFCFVLHRQLDRLRWAWLVLQHPHMEADNNCVLVVLVHSSMNIILSFVDNIQQLLVERSSHFIAQIDVISSCLVHTITRTA